MPLTKNRWRASFVARNKLIVPTLLFALPLNSLECSGWEILTFLASHGRDWSVPWSISTIYDTSHMHAMCIFIAQKWSSFIYTAFLLLKLLAVIRKTRNSPYSGYASEVIFKFDKFPRLSCSLQVGGLTPHWTQMNSKCTLFIFQRQKPWTTQMLCPYITSVTINVSYSSLYVF